MAETTHGCVVIKVGGSLFDLPDLGDRLRDWLRHSALSKPVLVPGGGPTADVVRSLDACHHLGEERSHWLALHALRVNAEFLASVLCGGAVADGLHALPALWGRGLIPILDAHAFCREDEARPGGLPHSWQVTSDSIAARVARVLGAAELVLLKSADLPAGGWAEAVRTAYVDAYFARAAERLTSVRAVNLRRYARPT